MLLETKFNIGEIVYIIHTNRVMSKTISNLNINCKGRTNNPLITYGFYGLEISIYEDMVFKTKQELLDSL